MKRLLSLLVLVVFLWPAAVHAAVALCAISGQVFNPDGTTLNNGTVQFNSQVTQVVGSTTIPPSIISTTTDSSGNMAPMSVAQGLFGTFQFCQGHSGTNVGGAGGGCAAAINGLIPINTTGNIQAVIAGTLLPSVGNGTVNNLTVTNNTMIGGTLQVSGLSTLNSLAVTNNTTLGGTLNVTGNTTAPTINLTQVGCPPAIALAEASIWSAPPYGNLAMIAGAHCNSSGQYVADQNSAVSYQNYYVAAGSINNAGWQWLGDTGLTVGSTYSPTLTMSLSSTPAYVAQVNHVGTLSTGSLVLWNTNSTTIHLPGGSILSHGNPNINVASGSHFDGTNWIADATSAANFAGGGGGLNFYANSGLTVGSPFAFNQIGLGSPNGWVLYGTNPVAILQSNTNLGADVLEIFPQNQTQGIGILWDEIHSIGTNANVAMGIDSKGSASLCLQCNDNGSPIYAQANINIQQDWHFNINNNGVVGPSLASCPYGAMYGGSTDNAGQVSFSSSGATQCLINFGRAFGASPVCVCSVFTSSAPIVVAACMPGVSTSQINMYFSGTVQNNTAFANWVCIGNG